MRFRWLALFPFLYAMAFLGAVRCLGDDPLLGSFVVGQRMVVRILGIVGCFAAVAVFERGDHLRGAWLWLGWGAVAIMLRDFLRHFPAFHPGSAGPAALVILSGLGILSNVTLLFGIWALARSWKMAAISLPGGRFGVAAVALVTAVLAAAVAGPEALKSMQAVANGDSGSLILFVSAVVDILSLCLITPLLLTAVSLRGGLFWWPWGLITASQLSWLLYDATAGPTSLLASGGFPLAEMFRGLAVNFLFTAGLAQSFVVRQVRRRSARGLKREGVSAPSS